MNIDFELLNKIPGAIGFKNKHSAYLGGNQLLATYMGYDKPQDIVGMRDIDIKSEMVVFADKFIKEDQEVMLKGEKQHIDIGRYHDGVLRATLSTKKPLLNKNHEIIGTAFSRVELKSSILSKLIDKLSNLKLPQYYSIGKRYVNYALNKREAESLFYIMRGYTAKEIAQLLCISSKTVEYHIEQLKNKFGCSKRSELVEKSIDLRFIYNIPISVLC